MCDYATKAENAMPREELRNVLYEWLREKGILGELQAFIQQKMVEKLNLRGLIPKPDSNLLEVKEEILRLFILDYLQHRKLFYTMSVLKVESLGSNFSNKDLKTLRRCLTNNLEVNDPLQNLIVSTSENTTLLENLIEAFRLRNRSEEQNEKAVITKGVSDPKLGINVQTQTGLILDTDQIELERNLNLPTKQINSKKMMILKPQDGAYSNACQTETSLPYMSKEQASGAIRLRILSNATSSIGQYSEDEAGNLVNNTSQHEKRIENAQHFLNVLDSRLLNISRRYQMAMKPADTM